MVGEYKRKGTSKESIERLSEILFRNPNDKENINLWKAKVRHDWLVKVINDPNKIIFNITYKDAFDGFRYTITDDCNDPKLVVMGMYEGDLDASVYKELICVADRIEQGAFSFRTDNSDGTQMTVLVMPFLDKNPKNAFLYQMQLKGLIAPKLVKQGHKETIGKGNRIPIYAKIKDIPEDESPVVVHG